MRRFALLVLLAGCGFEPMGLFAGWAACEEPPFTETMLYESRSITLVAATRGSCSGFPDAATDYRIYRVDGERTLVLEGTIEGDFQPLVSRDVDGSVLVDFDLQRCRITGDTGHCAVVAP